MTGGSGIHAGPRRWALQGLEQRGHPADRRLHPVEQRQRALLLGTALERAEPLEREQERRERARQLLGEVTGAWGRRGDIRSIPRLRRAAPPGNAALLARASHLARLGQEIQRRPAQRVEQLVLPALITDSLRHSG